MEQVIEAAKRLVVTILSYGLQMDMILVVDKGQIVEQGKHDELMKHDGIYKRFVNSREIAGSWKLLT